MADVPGSDTPSRVPHDPGLQGWSRDPNARRWAPAPLAVMERRLRARRGAQSPQPPPTQPREAEASLGLSATARSGLARWLGRSTVLDAKAPGERGPGGAWWAWALGPELGPLGGVGLPTRRGPEGMPPQPSAPSPAPAEGPPAGAASGSAPLGSRILRGALMGPWMEDDHPSQGAHPALPYLECLRSQSLLMHGRSPASARVPSPLLTQETPRRPRDIRGASPWDERLPTPEALSKRWAQLPFPEATPRSGALGSPLDTAPALEGARGPMAPEPDGPPPLQGSPLSGPPTLEFEDRRPFKLPRREPALGRFLMRLRGASVEEVAQGALGAVALSLHRAGAPQALLAISHSPCPGLGVDSPRLLPREIPAVPVPPCPEGPFEQLTTTQGDIPWSLPQVQGIIAELKGRLRAPDADARGSLPLKEALSEVGRWMTDLEPQLPLPTGAEVYGAVSEDLKALRSSLSSSQREEV